MQEPLDNMPELQDDEKSMIVSRVFAAPRKLVYEAFADPAQVAEWWHPHGFTMTILEMDIREGGKWRIIMHGPDGVNYPSEMTFLEVVPLERATLQVEGGREGAPLIYFTHTLEFEDEGEGTRLTVRNTFPTRELRDANVREYGSVQGLRDLLDRLESVLAHS